MNHDRDEDIEEFHARVRTVSDIFFRHPHNAIEELERLGFTYVVDDSEDENEIAEERAAEPRSMDEKTLVEYFESNVPPDGALLAIWRRATNADKPNYPLFRRYMRAGNLPLKVLLLLGLERNPADGELLSDLSFFHLFTPMLKELIALYMCACDYENDHECFLALAQDFDDHTRVSGYEALMALQVRYPAGSSKAQWVEQLIVER